MIKQIYKITNIIFWMILIVLMGYVLSMRFFPAQTSELIGYQLYTVLTDSMEPRIPTFSLACTKVIPKDEELNLKKGDIITFVGDRFGEEIVLTHHFNTYDEDMFGNRIYRTNAEGKKELDMYRIERKDIIGKYVFHIPFLGKIFLFLKSKFGLLMYAELAVVWLINRTIKARWEEKEVEKELQGFEDKKFWEKRRKRRLAREGDFVIRNLIMEKIDDCMVISGIVINKTLHKVHFVVAELTFYDAEGNIVSKDKWYLIGKNKLSMLMSKDFEYIQYNAENIVDYDIKVIAYKK